MPPKSTITRSQIIEAGLNIVRAGDFAQLSARRVARVLGCSTQPVYRLFDSMDELKKAIIDEIATLAMTYLTEDRGEHMPPMFQVGLGALHFARDEPELANTLAVAGPILIDIRHNRPPPPFVLQRMRIDPLLQGFDDSQLERIHAQLWFFSQGLISLFRAEGGDKSEVMAQAVQHLKMAGEAFIRFAREESISKGDSK